MFGKRESAIVITLLIICKSELDGYSFVGYITRPARESPPFLMISSDGRPSRWPIDKRFTYL